MLYFAVVSMQHAEISHCTRVTDAGLRVLTVNCPNLLTLHLDGLQKIQGPGLAAAAASCPSLTSLSLDRCGQFDDWTYQAVARGCRELRYLNLNHCPKVSDEAVKVCGCCCGAQLTCGGTRFMALRWITALHVLR